MSNTFISSSPYQCFPNTFQNFIILNGGNNITLPDYNKQTNIITFSNTTGSSVTLNSFVNNAPSVINLLTKQQITLTPEKSYGYYIISYSNASNPNYSWTTLGNSLLANNGVLGTTDAFDTWKIVEGGNTIANLINQGEINIPNVNIMSFGTRGTAASVFIIKQPGPTSTTATIGPAPGMQMISASDNNSFYWGIDSSDTFNIYSFVSPSTYKTLMTFMASGQVLMNNQNLSGLANPVNNQDAATKQYTDTKLMPLIPQMSGNSNNSSGFTVNLISGTTGFGDVYQPWNNPGLNNNTTGWGPNTSPTGTMNMTFPATTQFKIGGIMVTNRNSGSSPTLTGIVLSIGLNPPFFTYSGPPIGQANSTGLLTFPLSPTTNGVNVALTWSSTPFSGVSFIQLFGSL